MIIISLVLSFWTTVLLFPLPFSYLTVAAAAAADTTSTNDNNDIELECGLYLAPSTIPGSGLGMFAGKVFEPHETFQPTGDLVIPIIDLDLYHPHYKRSQYLWTHPAFHDMTKRDYNFLWNEYTWSGFAMGMSQHGIQETIAASPGFGSAANSVLGIYNVEEKNPRFDDPPPSRVDNIIMHRSKDPGVGAFTPYHNRESIAKYTIQPGQELFVSYGNNWFEGRSHLGPIPIFGDMEIASKLFSKFYNLQNRLDLKPHIKMDLWKTFLRSSLWNETSRVLGSFTSWNASVSDEDILWELENILQEKKQNKLLQNETEKKPKQETKNKHDHTLTVTNNTILYEKLLFDFKVQESMRTKQYLQDHGTCADNIQEGTSTLRQAGRGGFATRALRQDQIVAQVPLIHIPDKQILDLYELSGYNNKISDEKRKIGTQLLLNYCMGHRSSTLLFCNYGPTIHLINHNQTQANVKFQWSNSSHDSKYFNSSVSTFIGLKTAVLAMELVALRNIEQGEELFLDYGNEWEQAWLEHVANWKPSSETLLSKHSRHAEHPPLSPEEEQIRQEQASTMYRSAHYYNDLIYNQGTKLRTEFEQVSNPYPKNIQLMCDLYYRDNSKEDRNRQKNYLMAYDWTHCDVISSQLISTTQGNFYLYKAHAYMNQKDTYFDRPVDNVYNESQTAKEQFKVLKRIPIEAFRFLDRPYTSDMFLSNAFRHELRLSDDLFPKAWWNLEEL